jgi:cyclopropane fatty-acyl-phospholipid synthase-like methyltransferase
MKLPLKFFDNHAEASLTQLSHPLHRYQKMKRYEHALEMLKLSKNDKVLEIECGVGYQIPEIAKRCKDYLGCGKKMWRNLYFI